MVMQKKCAQYVINKCEEEHQSGTVRLLNQVLSIACLYDQSKSGFLEGRLFPANQGF